MGKIRLIIDFDNEEELKEFYKQNFEDLEKLKYLEARSKQDKIQTYYTEFENNTRTEEN